MISASTLHSFHHRRPRRGWIAGLTLVEIMVAMSLMVVLMVGFISSFMLSRRSTEASVLHAAASSLVYGIVEQLKGVDYTELLPSNTEDGKDPEDLEPPYVRVRVNQDLTKWLKVTYTPAPGTPKAPTGIVPAGTPAPYENRVGPLPLSTTAGTSAQTLTLSMWIWIDELPDVARDVAEVKRVTIIYAYDYNDGRSVKTIRDREVFLRTRYDQ